MATIGRLRLFDMFRHAGVSLFVQMSDDLIGDAARASSILKVAPGDVVCTQGAQGEAFNVIVGGIVDVLSRAEDGSEEARVLKQVYLTPLQPLHSFQTLQPLQP